MQLFKSDQIPTFFRNALGIAADTLRKLDLYEYSELTSPALVGKTAGFVLEKILEYKTPEAALQHALAAAYASSFLDALRKYRITLDLPEEEKRLPRTQNILANLFSPDEAEIQITGFDLRRFEANQWNEAFFQYFDLLLEEGKATEQQAIAVRNYVRDYAKINFLCLIERDKVVFNKFNTLLDSRAYEPILAQYYKEKYRRDLSYLYHNVVLGDEAGLLLSEVYIPPFFNIHQYAMDERAKISNKALRYDDTGRQKVFVDPNQLQTPYTDCLHTYLYAVLRGQQPIREVARTHHRVVFILGYPGQGKTSFCQRFFHDTYRTHEPQNLEQEVYALRFRDLPNAQNLLHNPTNELLKAINKKDLQLTEEAFLRGIWVLDGLDELYMMDNLQANEVEEICKALIRLTQQNEELKIVLTARYGYIGLESLRARRVLIVQMKPFSLAQQQTWLQKYRSKHPETCLTAALLKEINENEELKHLRELCEQPILLQIIAQLDEQLPTDTNRAKLYQLLFDKLTRRDWSKEGQLELLKDHIKNLRIYLQDIAFELFMCGGEYLHKTALAKIPSIQEDFGNLLDGKNDGLKKVLKLLMVAFYFKEVPKHASDQSDEAYEADRKENYAIEFLHKSLSEYLAAEKIWNDIVFLFTDKKQSRRRQTSEYVLNTGKAALAELAKLFARRRLTNEVRKNLIEIIQNEENTAQKQEIGERLICFMPYFLDKDFLYEYKLDQHDTPIDTCLHTFYGYWTVCSHLGLRKNLVPQTEIHKKRFVYLLHCLLKDQHFINLSHQKLEGADLSGEDLSRATLSGADLRGATLIGANLRNANLRGTNLSGADLRGANLRGLGLRGANLHDIDLSDTDLRGADLIGANLIGANLIGADLRGADLIGANLIGVNLRNMDLRYANLIGADLRNANLIGADLRGANLTSANLIGTDLRSANLSGTNFHNIKYEGKEKLAQQLANAKSLGNKWDGDCENLPSNVEEILRREHPYLFKW